MHFHSQSNLGGYCNGTDRRQADVGMALSQRWAQGQEDDQPSKVRRALYQGCAASEARALELHAAMKQKQGWENAKVEIGVYQFQDGWELNPKHDIDADGSSPAKCMLIHGKLYAWITRAELAEILF